MLSKRRAVKRVLRELATRTPDQIAKLLEQEGIRGGIGPRHCPIANYLRRETGVESVSVGYDTVVDGWLFPVPVPSPVERFIRDYDLGLYPSLDRYRIWSDYS